MNDPREFNMMAVRKVYSVFDKKTGSWDNPFTARTHGEAERMFSGALKDNQTLIGQYPEDFSLWHVGTFDPVSGIVGSEKAHCLGEAVAFKPRNNQN